MGDVALANGRLEGNSGIVVTEVGEPGGSVLLRDKI